MGAVQFHDPFWQFILNASIALLGIFVASTISWVIYRKQKNRKEIAYEVISDIPILSINEEVMGRVQVLLDGKSVSNVRLIALRIWNSGNVSISPEDYVSPITIKFAGKAEIIATDILEVTPSNVQAMIQIDQASRSVVLEPLLLNTQDSIKLKVLLSSDNGEVEVNARIKDVKQVLEAESSYLGEHLRTLLSTPIVPISILLYLLLFFSIALSHLFLAQKVEESLSLFLDPVFAFLLTFIFIWRSKGLTDPKNRFLFIILLTASIILSSLFYTALHFIFTFTFA